MSTTPLTTEAARRKIGEIFVYHMPFNRELGTGCAASTMITSS